MKVLAWNLNHRAARRAVPDWIVESLADVAPDVAILTEYVHGPDHDRFLRALQALGLANVSLSERPQRQNQVLIATREAHARQPLRDPGIHASLPSNSLSVTLESGIRVFGFRMPAYEGMDTALKRPSWEWLLAQASSIRDVPAIIAGDFNTAPGDPATYCGDCLATLRASGWQHALPESGYSWRGRSSKRQIDHAFLSAGLRCVSAEYSWSFRDRAPDQYRDTSSGALKPPPVGLPDHAMLIVEATRVDVPAHAT